MIAIRLPILLLFCWAVLGAGMPRSTAVAWSAGSGAAAASASAAGGAAAAMAAGANRSDARQAAAGAASRPAQPIDLVSDDARFSLLTILPGDQIYTLWGHSAIRVTDPERGFDLSFNYGTFRFDEYFLPNFLYGRLDYMLSVHDYEAALESYRYEGRPVIEQELRLTPAQKDSLYHFLVVNARPENRVYRYHFLFDNCSTRIRDALEHALGEDISFADVPDAGLTFRQLLDSGIAEKPFLDAGIDWLLGSPVDRQAQPYETMFLPVYLMKAFDHAQISTGGSREALVVRTDTVLWIPAYDERAATVPWAAILAWLLLAAGAGATFRAMRRGDGVARWLDVPLFALVGTAGLIIVFLWFISLHDVPENNWHLLWAWPSHLLAAVVLMRRRIHLWLLRYLLAAAVLAVLAAIGSPFLGQWFHPALYPLMILIAVRGIGIVLAARRHERAAAAAA